MRKLIESTLVSADGVVADPPLWAMEYRDDEVDAIVRGDVTAEVTRLKQDGGDIAIFGHGRLAQALLDSGLTDELRLSVHPVLAGHGGLLFRDGAKTPLRLTGAKPLGTGVVVLSYQPAYGERAGWLTSRTHHPEAL